VTFFKGTKQGFSAGVPLKEQTSAFADGKAFDMAVLMATGNLVDWDRDGDLDLVVGNVRGGVFLNLNEGTAKQSKFGERVAIKAAGEIMKVAGKSDPWPCDWDGDGIIDLLVASEAGDVTFFRGSAEGGFLRGVSLLTGHEHDPSHSYKQARERLGEDRVVPGYRFRLATADWNKDGKLDLLVGNCVKGEDGKTTGHVYLLLRQGG